MEGKNFGLILSGLWTKVHESLRRCRRLLVLSNALANWLYRFSFRIYSSLSPENEQMYTDFWPNVFGMDELEFSTTDC